MNANPIDIESLVAQQTQSNPKLKLLYDMMQKSQNQGKLQHTSKAKGQLKKLVMINKTLTKRNRILKHQQKKILKYLNFFIDVNTVFSSAVGACECWGEDNSCQHCNGQGNPGHFEVNEDAFQTYVLPCMERLETEQVPENNEKQQIINHLSNN